MARLKAKDLRQRLRAVATAFPQRVAALQKDLMTVGANAVINQTPVDTGRLRYGWTLTEGQPSQVAPPAGESFPDSAAATAAAAVAGATPRAPLFLTNNVEYAWVLETGAFKPPSPGPSKGRGKKGSNRRASTEGIVLVEGGYHAAAPQGMLVSGVAAIEARLRRYEAAGLPQAGGVT